MTKIDNPFHEYVEDLFSSLGQIKIRKMFGGSGVYAGEEMFALLYDGQVYLKTDDALKAELEQAGGRAFEWTNPQTGVQMKLSYVSMSADEMENSDNAGRLGRRALQAASDARQNRVKSPRRRAF